eukprot:gb/GECG01013433.1/.p1 GENE.gb/GECG01013433.1/~~gb/GECG01013433.1/.p1  ORF type:complete len:189 (+),score=17.89 gb/GECG01013433.1/:1-567(+)
MNSVLVIVRIKNEPETKTVPALKSLRQLKHYPIQDSAPHRNFQDILRDYPQLCKPVRILACTRPFSKEFIQYANSMNEVLPDQHLLLLKLTGQSMRCDIAALTRGTVSLAKFENFQYVFPDDSVLSGTGSSHPYSATKTGSFGDGFPVLSHKKSSVEKATVESASELLSPVNARNRWSRPVLRKRSLL